MTNTKHTRKPAQTTTSTAPIHTRLVVDAAAHSNRWMLRIYVSVSREDGTPVTGLGPANFALRAALTTDPGGGIEVPTSFTIQSTDAIGNPLEDELGNAIMETHPYVQPLALPGFYGISWQPPFLLVQPPTVLVAVSTATERGQTVVGALTS